jgi:uncharacterized delta-60 repeat protein
VKRVAILLGVALAALSLAGESSAVFAGLAGNLDASFGRGAVAAVSGGIAGVAVQPDGKIVTAGTAGTGNGGPGHFLLARYLEDGSLDSTFGNGGYAETAAGGAAYPHAVALQPDGKIVVAGETGPVSDTIGSEFIVARFDPDGSPDTSFGTDGVTTTAFPEPPGECGNYTSSRANAIAVLPDGDILAAGDATGNTCDTLASPPSFFALARYTASGSLDPSFGSDGIVQTDFSGQYGIAGASSHLAGIAVQPDGQIVASGSSGYGGHGVEIDTMALTRYNSDGSIDANFGLLMTSPKLHFNGGPPILDQGKILVAGTTCRKSCDSGAALWFPVLARYYPDGGGPDTARIGRITDLGPYAVVRQADGKILIAESSFQQQRSVIVRLLANGQLDSSFGKGGVVDLGSETTALALQPDEKIIVGGVNGNAWLLTRLLGGYNCAVPRLRGKTVATADAALKKTYCRRGATARRYSSKVMRGRVISTNPPSGARIPGRATIEVFVSRGKRP